ncbi:hypothetical protein BKA67DRAFT_669528, partial [Truncatella angustata]
NTRHKHLTSSFHFINIKYISTLSTLQENTNKMQFSNALLAILSAAATAEAGCFTKGDGNGQGDGHYGQGLNQYDILSSVAPLLKGHYLSNEDRTQCAMDTYQNKWRFYVKASFRDPPIPHPSGSVCIANISGWLTEHRRQAQRYQRGNRQAVPAQRGLRLPIRRKVQAGGPLGDCFTMLNLGVAAEDLSLFDFGVSIWHQSFV